MGLSAGAGTEEPGPGLGWAGGSERGQPGPTSLSQLAHSTGAPRWGRGNAGDAVSAFTLVGARAGTTGLDRAQQADRCCDAGSVGAAQGAVGSL